MLCPIDGAELRMSDRNGVEIDYCPQCRGVWLDRGELDKINERAALAESNAVERRAAAALRGERYDDDDDFDDYVEKRKRGEDYGDESYRKPKRKGFLGDIFDILD